MAVQTIDAVLLLITFGTWKFCENFINEDNFNNTYFNTHLANTIANDCYKCRNYYLYLSTS